MSRVWWTRSVAWWSAGHQCSGWRGAFGVALAAYRGDDVAGSAAEIERARPTAVNLGWGARRALAAYRQARQDPAQGSQRAAARAAVAEARAIAAEDAAASAAMARHGLSLIPEGARVLTHCNTGALVSAGEGTAFAVILAAHRAGRLAQLWIDETRPLLQGARLTAYEARRGACRTRCWRLGRRLAAGRGRGGHHPDRRGPDRGGRQRGEQGRHLRPRGAG